MLMHIINSYSVRKKVESEVVVTKNRIGFQNQTKMKIHGEPDF